MSSYLIIACLFEKFHEFLLKVIFRIKFWLPSDDKIAVKKKKLKKNDFFQINFYLSQLILKAKKLNY